MISANDLTEEQRKSVEEWVEEGSQLADIQKRLKGQFGLNVTYMDTRFLILDLGLEIRSESPEPRDSESDPASSGAGEPSPAIVDPDQATGAGAGTVTVTSDELARPGALVSGKVTFSDGETALWLIDQMGRLGLEPDTPGYQPSEADAVAFEGELRKLLEK